MLKSLVVKMLAGVGIGMLMLVIFLGPGAFSAYAGCSSCEDIDCKNIWSIAPCGSSTCHMLGFFCGGACGCWPNDTLTGCWCAKPP